MEKNGIEKSHEYSIDLFKAIACIFIIFIHCKLPGTAGGVMEALARFGVPLFFAVSGFLTVILLSFLYLAEMLKIYYPIRPFDISISTWYVVRNISWFFFVSSWIDDIIRVCSG